jgi:peptidoglycan/xylan/chitin deacetylase (PgdA/CDA1 family)
VKISLTIDNGPDPEVTPQVLDTLAQRQCPAAFFVLGSKIETAHGKALVQRAAKDGHRIGNHTYSHSFFFGHTDNQANAVREIDLTQSLLGDLGHERMFRPYGGDFPLGDRIMSRTVYEHLRANEYSCVLWNHIPRDWENPMGWPEIALGEVRINPWSVIVVHDLPTGAMDQLGGFIDRARDIGAEFVRELPEAVTPLLGGHERWSMRNRGLLSDR